MSTASTPSKPLELVCPAGNLPSLKTAVDHGADSVYIGFRDDTNARHFPGLNFDAKTAVQGVQYAHAKGRRVFVASTPFRNRPVGSVGGGRWIKRRTWGWTR
jgi:collagenase-like PrtC family protease